MFYGKKQAIDFQSNEQLILFLFIMHNGFNIYFFIRLKIIHKTMNF